MRLPSLLPQVPLGERPNPLSVTLSAHENRGVRRVLRKATAKLESIFLYYSYSSPPADGDCGEDLLAHRRMTITQLFAFCRQFCLCPGLLSRQTVLEAYTLAGGGPDGLAFPDFCDLLAVMAVECEWFRRREGDGPTRLTRFLQWMDVSINSERIYEWGSQSHTHTNLSSLHTRVATNGSKEE